MAIADSVTQVAPSCGDHELVACVRQGSDRAFEQLYARYGTRIRSYVLGMVGDYGRAEDLTQEVFISALRRLRDTERPIVFKPWIFEIAKNACIDEFRRTRRSREVSLDGDQDSDAMPAQSTASAPEAAFENKQRLDDLRGAFHGLSGDHHRLIVMREFEGLSYEQIGQRMGMAKPLVQSSLFRARRRLTQEYEELVSGRRCEHVQTVIAADGQKPLLSLGVRERRQLARHLAHCQPCRRVARLAAVDESFFRAPGLAGKIAALLPFGWLRVRRGGILRASGAHSASALRPLQSIAPMVDPTSLESGFGRVAAAAAALAVATAGGGVVVHLGGHGPNRQAQATAGQAVAVAVTAAASVSNTAAQAVAASARSTNVAGWRGRSSGAVAVHNRAHWRAWRHRTAFGGGSGTGAGGRAGSGSAPTTGSAASAGSGPPGGPSTGSGSTGGGSSAGVGGLVPKLPPISVSSLPTPPSAVQNLLQSPPLNAAATKLPQAALTVQKVANIVGSLGHAKSPG